MPTFLTAFVDGARVEVSAELIARYDRPLPRYTSYPPADRWRAFTGDEGRGATAPFGRSDEERAAPISLYVHIPFCGAKCAFCGCHSIATADRAIMDRYTGACIREIGIVADRLGAAASVAQIHFGGGTPTSVGLPSLGRLLGAISAHMAVAPDAEVAIELDPRVICPGDIESLCACGFNRMSFGVQDFDPAVGRAIGRMTDRDGVRSMIDAARRGGVRGINIDLIYGLPGQTQETWGGTLCRTAELCPDRIAVFNFAHLPRLLPHQRRLSRMCLPSAIEKLLLFTAAIEGFQRAGYAFIGLDHFAGEGDALAEAHRAGTLTRNFQGYAAGAGLPIVGVGTTAISEIGDAYLQNEKKLARYLEAIETGAPAAARGVHLTRDDEMRRSVIRHIMCRQRIERASFEERWGVALEAAFPEAAERLRPLIDDGMVVEAEGILAVTPLGRLFIRAVASAFDATLDPAHSPYSRAI